jgi:hypothetical protein
MLRMASISCVPILSAIFLSALHSSIFSSREWTSVVFELDDTLGRLSCHVMDGILITQPVRALDGIVHVPPPVVLVHAVKAMPSVSMSSHYAGIPNGTYFPSAALIPPCAATVWDLVGNSLDMHAVLKPASARPKAARRPEPPAPTTMASYS